MGHVSHGIGFIIISSRGMVEHAVKYTFKHGRPFIFNNLLMGQPRTVNKMQVSL